MAELVVIGYPDETTAQRAFDTAVGLQRELILELASAAIVRLPDQQAFRGMCQCVVSTPPRHDGS